MAKWYRYSAILDSIDTLEVERETEHFLVVRHHGRKQVKQKLTDHARWFSTAAEALLDAHERLEKDLERVHNQYPIDLKDLLVNRAKLVATAKEYGLQL